MHTGEKQDRKITPSVSIIVPVYSCTEYITEALDSILAQTFSDFEIIVVNDGSPDSDELEKALMPYQSRIRYIRQDNRGAAAARNTALRIATAPVVAFLDADDVWLPNFLAEQINFIEKTGADLVYSDALLIGDSPLAGRTYMETAPSHGEVTAKSLLGLDCNVMTSGVVARRALVMQVGMFNEAIKRAHDFDLWVRLAKHGAHLAYQRKVLLKHRLLESGLSGNLLSQYQRALHVLETIPQRVDLTLQEQNVLAKSLKKVAAGFHLEQGKIYLLEKNFVGAVEAFSASNRSRRSWKVHTVLVGLRLAPQLLWCLYSRRVSSSSS